MTFFALAAVAASPAPVSINDFLGNGEDLVIQICAAIVIVLFVLGMLREFAARKPIQAVMCLIFGLVTFIFVIDPGLLRDLATSADASLHQKRG